jgi:hypothetical protein
MQMRGKEREGEIRPGDRGTHRIGIASIEKCDIRAADVRRVFGTIGLHLDPMSALDEQANGRSGDATSAE